MHFLVESGLPSCWPDIGIFSIIRQSKNSIFQILIIPVLQNLKKNIQMLGSSKTATKWSIFQLIGLDRINLAFWWCEFLVWFIFICFLHPETHRRVASGKKKTKFYWLLIQVSRLFFRWKKPRVKFAVIDLKPHAAARIQQPNLFILKAPGSS